MELVQPPTSKGKTLTQQIPAYDFGAIYGVPGDLKKTRPVCLHGSRGSEAQASRLRSKSGGILSTLEVGGLDVLGTPVSGGGWDGGSLLFSSPPPKM